MTGAALSDHAAARRPLAEPGEVADYLKVAEKTLAQWRWRKTGPRWVKVGREVRYRWEDVDAWLTVGETVASA